MLVVNIWGKGKEHYAAFYPSDDFNEDNFMDEHSEDYTDLEDDNIDIEVWGSGMDIGVNLNGKEVKVEGLISSASIVNGNELNLRQHVDADDDDVAVYWSHPGIVEYEFTWDTVDNFDSSKLKIHFFKEDVFNYMTYDGEEADEYSVINFEPKYGYEGPQILYPGDETS
jgi:hypothetical protein